jgi:hypothetical protein
MAGHRAIPPRSDIDYRGSKIQKRLKPQLSDGVTKR